MFHLKRPHRQWHLVAVLMARKSIRSDSWRTTMVWHIAEYSITQARGGTKSSSSKHFVRKDAMVLTASGYAAALPCGSMGQEAQRATRHPSRLAMVGLALGAPYTLTAKRLSWAVHQAVQLSGTMIQCLSLTRTTLGTEQACQQLTANQRA